MTRKSLRVALPLAMSLVMAGCASAPKDDPKLEQARTELDAMKADNNVQTHAPDALLDAEQALKRAENAHKNRDKAAREHQYYLAKRYMETAQAVTETNVVQEKTIAIGEERERLALAARDAELARQRSELATRESRLEELEAELSALEAKRTERGMVVTLDDVFFETAAAKIASGGSRTLNKVVSLLKENPEQRIIIEGHTDAVGNAEYNQRLSEQRAEAVKQEIVARGIVADRVIARGYGEGRPVATNATQAGRQLNRRVEIFFPNGE